MILFYSSVEFYSAETKTFEKQYNNLKSIVGQMIHGLREKRPESHEILDAIKTWNLSQDLVNSELFLNSMPKELNEEKYEILFNIFQTMKIFNEMK